MLREDLIQINLGKEYIFCYIGHKISLGKFLKFLSTFKIIFSKFPFLSYSRKINFDFGMSNYVKFGSVD